MKKKFIAWVPLLFSLLVGAYFIDSSILPLYSQIQTIEEQMLSHEKTIQKWAWVLSVNLPTPEIEDASTFSISRYLTGLNSKVSGSNVHLKSLVAKKSEGAYTLNLQGSFGSLFKFLHAFEHTDMAVTVIQKNSEADALIMTVHFGDQSE